MVLVRDFMSQRKSIILSIPPGKNDIYFCFAGEFGYEIISWIPYLLYLKKHTDIKLNTVARPGSRLFYYFSDNHLEVSSKEITDCWGDKKNYLRIGKKLNLGRMVYPANNYSDKRRIIINGFEWVNKDIHKPIIEKNYEKPDYSKVNQELPFSFKNFVVINNKFVREWGKTPINYFDRESLIEMRDALLAAGYSVVYNRFIEVTSSDEFYTLEDDDIFMKEGCFDMRKFYEQNTDIELRNKIQVSAFNKASFVIGVQGGNVYIPAISQQHILMLMRKGGYLDYQELARLFGGHIEVFYEPRHLLDYLRLHIFSHQ